MLAKAYTKYLRISARKVRLVVELVKGKNLEEALSILDGVNKGARFPLKKTISSAFANLNHARSEKLLAKDVVISALWAEGGPTLHRFRAASMGRATPIKHRTSHIYVELDRVSGPPPADNASKTAAAQVEKKEEKAPSKARKAGDTRAIKPKKTAKTVKSGSK